MDTLSSIEEANGHSSTKSNSSTKYYLSRKCKALLLVSGVLAVLVVAATIVTIVVTFGTLELRNDRHGDESDSKGQRDHLIDIETRQLIDKQVYIILRLSCD